VVAVGSTNITQVGYFAVGARVIRHGVRSGHVERVEAGSQPDG
jgi:hypothetical protein